jgi:hypothetical protein
VAVIHGSFADRIHRVLRWRVVVRVLAVMGVYLAALHPRLMGR